MPPGPPPWPLALLSGSQWSFPTHCWTAVMPGTSCLAIGLSIDIKRVFLGPPHWPNWLIVVLPMVLLAHHCPAVMSGTSSLAIDLSVSPGRAILAHLWPTSAPRTFLGLSGIFLAFHWDYTYSLAIVLSFGIRRATLAHCCPVIMYEAPSLAQLPQWKPPAGLTNL